MLLPPTGLLGVKRFLKNMLNFANFGAKKGLNSLL